VLTRYKIDSGTIVETTEETSPVLVFVAPDDAERRTLREQFALDDYDMASLMDSDEIPRLEVVGERTFIIWKIPERAQIGGIIDLGVLTAGLVIYRGRLAIILPKGEIATAAREFRGVTTNAAFLLAFIQHTIRHYVGHLRAIKMMSGDIEKQITVSMENRYLLQMFSLSECLVYYIDSLEGNSVVLTKLRSLPQTAGIDAALLPTLDDIILENNQASRQANIYSSVLSGLMDARGTIINNNMNVLLTNLTLINIIFLPLNLVASIGGMSEWSMMTHGIDWRISYGVFVIAMVFLGWGTWLLVRRIIERRGGNHHFSRRKKRR
jgi:magnesium transporter